MKVKFKDLPVGSCYIDGKALRKKIGDQKAVIVRRDGRVAVRRVKGDPEVEPQPCPLKYLGVGLRRHPDMVVEIGDGNIIKRLKRINQ